MSTMNKNCNRDCNQLKLSTTAETYKPQTVRKALVTPVDITEHIGVKLRAVGHEVHSLEITAEDANANCPHRGLCNISLWDL